MKQCKRCKGTGRIRPKGKTGPNPPFKIRGFIINPSKKIVGKYAQDAEVGVQYETNY